MIKVDRNNLKFEAYGDTVDVITDIGYAIFNVVCAMSQLSHTDWNKTLEKLMRSIEGSVKYAYQEAQSFEEKHNDTHG